MAKPLGGYTETVGKQEGTEVALPKRVVRNIAIMPSDSCCELRMLFERGLISADATIWCYENGHQVAFDAMEKAVKKVVGQYWSKAKINKQVYFLNEDIVECDVWTDEDIQLDWVYLDFCGVVDVEILAALRKWNSNVTCPAFSDDVEISVTCCHKLRYKSKELTPIFSKLAKRASKVGAYARGGNSDMHEIVIGTQVGIAEALPFVVTVRESLTYGRGMTTTRFSRVAGTKRRVSGVFKARVANARPKWARGLSGAQWAWHKDNPNGIRRAK